jgi:hypothetical protein
MTWPYLSCSNNGAAADALALAMPPFPFCRFRPGSCLTTPFETSDRHMKSGLGERARWRPLPVSCPFSIFAILELAQTFKFLNDSFVRTQGPNRPVVKKGKIMFSLSRLFFFGITNMIGVDSCVFLIFTTRVDPNKRNKHRLKDWIPNCVNRKYRVSKPEKV